VVARRVKEGRKRLSDEVEFGWEDCGTVEGKAPGMEGAGGAPISLLARGCPGFETLRASEGRGAPSDDDDEERKLPMKRLRKVVALVGGDAACEVVDPGADLGERAAASAPSQTVNIPALLRLETRLGRDDCCVGLESPLALEERPCCSSPPRLAVL